ncbi:MAG TPA: 2-oxoacid:acceptor oxidoreductase family protein [Acidimicrobiales bacterium]
MDRELLLSGIGGQGVQLAAQIVARAALAEGRQVQVFGSYGGMMRGGNTEATVVVADGPIESPPTVTCGWSGILVHPEYAAPTVARLARGAVVLFNSTVFPEPPGPFIGVPATSLAVEAGNIVAASLVMLGAFSAVTGLVGLDALVDSVADALPPYRRQHVALNQEALRLGHAGAPADRHPAWA